MVGKPDEVAGASANSEIGEDRPSRLRTIVGASNGVSAVEPVPSSNAPPANAPANGPASRNQPALEHRAWHRAAADAPVLDAPSFEAFLETSLELNRSVGVEMTDEQIVRHAVWVLGRLFPGRRFLVRLFFPNEPGVSFVHAGEGPARRASGSVTLTRAAVEQHRIAPSELSRVGAEVVDQYVSQFAESEVGFDVPLLAGRRLVGTVGVEYQIGLSEPADDRAMLVPLLFQVASSVRNARLVRKASSVQDNLSKLLDHANAPIVIIGRDRELRVINRAFLSLTGVSREQLLERDFLTLMPESERARVLPVFTRALDGEMTANFELRIPRGHGPGSFRIVINTAPLVAADGEIEGVMAIGRDLTELRRLEQQILHAEKLATLGQLAAGVVHELNNPLTSISVYGEYLLSKGEREGYDLSDLEKLRRIVQSADRMLKFTRDLVTYARPSSEQPDEVQVQDILEQSLCLCDHLLREHNATVERSYEDGDATVYAVKGQLHQVFVNLITNACHALSKRGGTVVMRTRMAEGRVLVEVEDDGCGIPRAARGRIFEPFFSTKREGEGTGLGLSIVRNILEQHGGTIDVRDRPEGGTVFAVHLPRSPHAPGA